MPSEVLESSYPVATEIEVSPTSALAHIRELWKKKNLPRFGETAPSENHERLGAVSGWIRSEVDGAIVDRPSVVTRQRRVLRSTLAVIATSSQLSLEDKKEYFESAGLL